MTEEVPKKALGEERYGIALVMILLACVCIMALPEGSWSRVAIMGFEGMALIASTRAAQAHIRIRIACGFVALIAFIMSIVLAAAGADPSSIYVSGASAALVLIATPIIALGIIRQVKRGQQVTVHTMMGVLCIYLLMTIAFASAFGFITGVSNDTFFQQGLAFDHLRDYLYFSVTTITTLGLGDFSPATDIGRALTAAEALIGQIYLVTVVAVIVGNLGRARNA